MGFGGCVRSKGVASGGWVAAGMVVDAVAAAAEILLPFY